MKAVRRNQRASPPSPPPSPARGEGVLASPLAGEAGPRSGPGEGADLRRTSAGLPRSALSHFFLAIALLLAACAPAPGVAPAREGGVGQPAAPKKITVGIRGDPATLSAKLNSAAGAGGTPGASQIEEMLNAGLAIDDSARVLHVQLAEAVPSVDNGLWKVFADGTMETTWKIRAGAAWHDGTAFTSDDLLFTAQVQRDRELPIFRNVAYEAIDTVEAPDPGTISIRWKRPFIEADTMFTSRRALPMPRHILEQPYLEDKQDFVNLPYWNREFVGTGAYKLQEWVAGSHLVMEANDRYVLGRPKIDRIEVKFIPDPNTLGANILAGGIDLTLGGRLALDWGIQVRDQWREGKMVMERATSAISHYPQFLNPSPAVIAEPQFRRALLHAIDRQTVIDSIVGGLGPMGHSIINTDHAEWRDVEPLVAKYGYDARKAASMIEGLGYTRGPDGIFRDPGGQRLSVELRTQATDDNQMKVMFTTADYWQQVGVASEQVPFPQQRAQDREYRATRPGFETVRQPGGWWELQRFYGPNTPLPENNFTGVNRTRHRNPEFDALIDRFFSTAPRPERVQVLGQLVRYMTDQVLILGMFFDPGPVMMSNRLRNLSDPGDVWDAHLWDLQ